MVSLPTTLGVFWSEHVDQAWANACMWLFGPKVKGWHYDIHKSRCYTLWHLSPACSISTHLGRFTRGAAVAPLADSAPKDEVKLWAEASNDSASINRETRRGFSSRDQIQSSWIIARIRSLHLWSEASMISSADASLTQKHGHKLQKKRFISLTNQISKRWPKSKPVIPMFSNCHVEDVSGFVPSTGWWNAATGEQLMPRLKHRTSVNTRRSESQPVRVWTPC